MAAPKKKKQSPDGSFYFGKDPRIEVKVKLTPKEKESFTMQASEAMRRLSEMYGVFAHAIGEEDRDVVAQGLLAKAIEVWERPLGWRFEVNYNVGQDTYWLTASYCDNDEGSGEVLVSYTVEFTSEVMHSEDYELMAERKLEELWRKCEAELAMFE